LRWGRQPRDLDAHLWLPEGGTHAHITGQNAGHAGEFPFAAHEGDIQAGFGPETITIAHVQPGSTRYAVRLFAGSGTLGTAGATVDIYEGSAGGTPVRTFAAPASAAWDLADDEFVWWHVFDLVRNGDTVSIAEVNEPSTNPAPYPDPTGLAFRLASGKGKTDPYQELTAQSVAAPAQPRARRARRDRSHTKRRQRQRRGKQHRSRRQH
jgi:hypothetical protein